MEGPLHFRWQVRRDVERSKNMSLLVSTRAGKTSQVVGIVIYRSHFCKDPYKICRSCRLGVSE